MNDKATPEEIAEHIASIKAIPETHITESERLKYLAEADRDVYAYSSVNAWYIWFENIRIPLAPLADIVWQIGSWGKWKDNTYTVNFHNQEGKHSCIAVHLQPKQDPWLQMVALTNDVAKWHRQPSEYDGKHLAF